MAYPLLALTTDRIIQDEHKVHLDAHDGYQLAYREFVEYFDRRSEITTHDLVIGAHFVYGWMPTILELRVVHTPHGTLDRCVTMLNHVKAAETLSEAELATLRSLINNSMVGVSKLLHFVNPSVYAIWDSRVCSYLFRKPSDWSSMQDPGLYMRYMQCCREVTRDPRFAQVHESMNRKIGYPVTPLRALELVMYTCSPH